MSYIQDSLSEGEKIVRVFRQHWVTRIWLVIWILLIVTIPIAMSSRSSRDGRSATSRSSRFRCRSSIVSRHTEEMKIGSIETVEIDQGVWGRILGFGDVKVTGRGLSDVVLRTIDDPMEVKRQIEGVSHPAV